MFYEYLEEGKLKKCLLALEILSLVDGDYLVGFLSGVHDSGFLEKIKNQRRSGYHEIRCCGSKISREQIFEKKYL